MKTSIFEVYKKRLKMKQKAIIIICLLGILGLSSCRSTSTPCGFAENTIIETQRLNATVEVL